MKFALAGVSDTFGDMLLPVIDAIAPKLAAFSAWAQANPGLMKIVVGTFVALTAAVVALNIAMSLNPISLIVIGIGLLIAGLAAAYIKFEAFRKVVDLVFGAIKFGVTKIAIPYIKMLVDIWKGVFNAIASIWNNTLGKISFTVPSWIPKIGGAGFSFPQIPMLAEGGIVNAPTLAIIGEAGPEAVVPLDRMNEFGMGRGGNNVTINVQGGDPQAVVDALVKYSRQNGSLPSQVKLAS
jgi:hypothetical protein